MSVSAADYEGEVKVFAVAFTSPDRSFGIVIVDDGTERFPLVGPVCHLESDDRVRVVGRREQHPSRGERVRALELETLDPDNADARIAYLKSLPGFGPKRAATAVQRLGENAFEIIDADPRSVLARFLPASKAVEAAEAWGTRRLSRELHMLLGPLGLAHVAPLVEDRFGEQALATVREDPFALTELAGVGFATADRIAASVGFSDPARRAQAACVHILKEAADDGHAYLPADAVVEAAGALLDTHVEVDALVTLAEDGRVVDEEGRVYLARIHATEIDVAHHLRRRAQRVLTADEPAAAGAGAGAAGGPDGPELALSEEQLDAAEGALRDGVTVVTGGPGCGKTTLISEIVRSAEARDLSVALCAPTGKAARRMAEATGVYASTVHRLLGWGADGPVKCAADPVEADVVVCDEASMLNLSLLALLLDALEPHTRLVLVGDADQLPPIGAGQPFADLVAAGAVPVHRLTEVFRQARRSLLVRAAHEINSGRPPGFEAGADDARDLFLVERTNPEELVAQVVGLAADRLPSHLGIEPSGVQVIAPMHRGPAGVHILNERLRAALNPDGAPAYHQRFRLGDRLLATRNDHENGLMNGEIVTLLDDDKARQRLVLSRDGDVVTIGYETAASLTLGYAITVHKAQGSESPAIVLALHQTHRRMLVRPLIYTALTRARRACCVVGARGLLEQAAAHTGPPRFTGLPGRLV
jgi:exodeoxyribonuclease V alpha subunit